MTVIPSTQKPEDPNHLLVDNHTADCPLCSLRSCGRVRKHCSMATIIEEIQKWFSEHGWSVKDKAVVTFDGGTLWMAFGKRKKQTFASHGGLVRKHGTRHGTLPSSSIGRYAGGDHEPRQVIVPFCRPSDTQVA